MEEVRKINATLPTSVDTAVFGPPTWRLLHEIVDGIPCNDCQREASSFMTFWHDLKNYELGKQIFDKKNFSYWIRRISSLNKRKLILK